MDPRDILGAELHPNAAIQSPHDARDHQWEEVGYGTAPFDWNVGFDVEAGMSKVLGTTFVTPTKDQGQSGSCGGQAVSYLGGTFSVFQNKAFNEKSAKYIYAPVAYPGGGSVGRDLCERVINAGWAAESLCPSYQNGNPPTEAFMELVADLTPAANTDAASDKGMSYALVSSDIDSVAQAAAAGNGLLIGVQGANNGTWLSPYPKPPTNGDQNLWGHWLAVGKAKLINGIKHVAVHNSWGATVGEVGWQWLGEDYFTTVLSGANRNGPAIFESRVIVYNPNATIPASFHHTFTLQMQLNSTGPEVQALQTALQVDADFPANVAPTQFFGNITQTAVQKFQAKYGIASAGTPATTGYGKVGPKTIAKLNALFAQ
jgi:hypothetical protein